MHGSCSVRLRRIRCRSIEFMSSLFCRSVCQRNSLSTSGTNHTLFLSLSRDPLDVRQFPRLVENRFLRTIETKEHFELYVLAGRTPIGVLPRRGFRSEPDV